VLQVALNTEIFRRSVQNILKQAKYHPYKIHLVHEFNEDDFDRRLELRIETEIAQTLKN
jgi:hypothetical protein